MQIYYQDIKKDNRNKTEYPLPTIGCVTMFLTGWIGMQIIAYIYQLIAQCFITKESNLIQVSFYINFLTYITIAIALVLELFFFDRANFKSRLKDFTHGSSYLSAISFVGIYLVCNMIYTYVFEALIIKITGITISSSENQSALNAMFASNKFGLSFMTIILAPIVEELTYRLGLFESIRRYNKTLALIISSFVFALIHMDILGLIMNFTQAEFINELLNFPAYLIGALVLTEAYNKHLSIVESMLTHAFINLLSIIVMFISYYMPSSTLILQSSFNDIIINYYAQILNI